jgi:hypothetical protein
MIAKHPSFQIGNNYTCVSFHNEGVRQGVRQGETEGVRGGVRGVSEGVGEGVSEGGALTRRCPLSHKWWSLPMVRRRAVVQRRVHPVVFTGIIRSAPTHN